MNSKLKQILVIEDAPDFQLIFHACLSSDFHLTICANPREALGVLVQTKFDLMIVDLVLPEMDGYQMCREIRSSLLNHAVPIIVISSKSQLQEKLMAFTLGASDYLTKPIIPQELVARVHANIGRPHHDSEKLQSETIAYPNLEGDLRSRRFYLIQGDLKSEIELTKTESSLLAFFMKNPDQVFTRQQLLVRVWGDNLKVTERTVDTHISKLRTKLRPYQDCLEPVYGIGYRFNINCLSRARAS